MNEIWKDIKGHEGLYQVSNEGNVRSIDRYVKGTWGNTRFAKGEIKKYHLGNNGYFMVNLFKNNCGKMYLVHRLVAEAFIPNSENKPFVGHKNTKRTDNRVENLEWCTRIENNNNPITKKKSAKTRSIVFTNRKDLSKKVYQYSKEGELIAVWPSIAEASRNGYSRQNISLCCNKKHKTHKGYEWSFEPM